MRILIAESNGMSATALATLATAGEVIAADLDRAELLTALEGVGVLWVRLRTQIDAELIQRARQLRIIATPTTGLDHIDLEAAARGSIRVISLRDAQDLLKNVRATAELAIGLMLSLLRSIPAATADVNRGRWDRDSFKGRELYGKTVGIVGYGRLGRLVAGYLRAFGCHVIAAEPKPGPDVDVPLVPLRELLAAADLVTIHVNLTAETRGLIGSTELAAMRPGALLVNTSRGQIVDDAALLAALASGHLGGAALDVLDGESSAGVAALPLVAYARTHRGLIITPHIGGCTHESMEMTENYLAAKVCEALHDE